MKCVNPIRLKNDRGNPYFVPCGHCAWCMKQKRDNWYFRLYQEKKDHIFSRFLTLTYRDEDLPFNVDETSGEMVPTVSKSDVRSFHEALWDAGFDFRYMLCSEYGPKTRRPHYHGIYFSNDRIPYLDYWRFGDNNKDLPARDSSFKYICKYMLKGANVPDGADANFHVESRRPGIGHSFVYKGEPYILGPGGVKLVPGHYYRRNYVNSLDDKLRTSLKATTMDYLQDRDEFAHIRSAFEHQDKNSGSYIGDFDTFKSEMYMKDFKSQIKINSK